MRILFTSDLHGDQLKYQELLDLVTDRSVDLVILGGDLFPRRGNGSETLAGQLEFIDSFFRPFLTELRAHLKHPTGYILGNNDWLATDPALRKIETEGTLFALHGQNFELDDLAITGWPWVPPTPFIPKDVERRDMEMDQAFANAGNAVISKDGHLQHVDEIQYLNEMPSIEKELAVHQDSKKGEILVFHSPPFDTALDQSMSGRSLGSKAILNFIRERQPLLTLHGHIHESPTVSGAYLDHIGNTLAMNPGQASERLSAVVFDPGNIGDTVSHTTMDKT